MQINRSSGHAWLIRALLMIGIGLSVASCGAELGETTTSSVQSDPIGSTAGLGVPPQSQSVRPISARPIKASATPELAKQVRSLEGISTPGSDGYRIGPQDVLDISVYQAADLAKTVQVAETGTINLPLVGDIQAGGVTARELERSLKAQLKKTYFQDPQVTVFVKEYNSQRVTLEGAISKPGVYPYRGPTTLLQLIATAGGLNDIADGADVMVFRTSTGARQAAKFDVDAIKAGRAVDPPIIQGDVVIVNASSGKKFYQDILKTLPMVGVFGLLL
jgi:polysaccharide export outer membrane protein